MGDIHIEGLQVRAACQQPHACQPVRFSNDVACSHKMSDDGQNLCIQSIIAVGLGLSKVCRLRISLMMKLVCYMPLISQSTAHRARRKHNIVVKLTNGCV